MSIQKNTSNNGLSTSVAQKTRREFLGVMAVTTSGAWSSFTGWNSEVNYAQLVPNASNTVRFTDLITSAAVISNTPIEVFGASFWSKTQASASGNFYVIMYKEY